MQRFQSASKEYVRVPIRANEAGIAVNPTGDAVTLAVTREPTAATATFYAGSWETAGTTYYARMLIGSGSAIGTLTSGVYNVFVHITDSPEIPIIYAGQIRIV